MVLNSERAEIKDAISYLRIINQKFDDLALERVIGAPKGVLVKILSNLLFCKSKKDVFGGLDNKNFRRWRFQTKN